MKNSTIEKRNRKTAGRRYGDGVDRSSKVQITVLAFLLATILITLASVSLVYVGRFASKVANSQAATNQQSLLRTALNAQFTLIARDQQSLARWDKSAELISLDFDRDFVVDEFFDSLWFDYGLDRNLLVDQDDSILSDAHQDKVSFHSKRLDRQDPLYHFTELARKQYFDNRFEFSDGYGQKQVSLSGNSTDAPQGFTELNGSIALIRGMAIVPDDGEEVLPDGNPVILLSLMKIDDELIAELGRQLGIEDMKFYLHATNRQDDNQLPVLSAEGKPLGVFSWYADMPGRHIWEKVVPVIVVLGVSLGAVALTIAWKIGKLTVSLGQSERHNWYLAMHDSLTGLANRLCYNRALSEALEQLPEIPFTLMHCDLDKFKQVNDTLGHSAGDTVIQTTARRLSEIVQNNGLVCRTGGDEFVILLKIVEHSTIAGLAARIIEEVRQPVETEPGIFARIGISLGIAIAPHHGTESKALMNAADAALYKAKEAGRNRAEFVEGSLSYQAEVKQV